MKASFEMCAVSWWSRTGLEKCVNLRTTFISLTIFEQSELRKSRLIRLEDGDNPTSLHSPDVPIPEEMPNMSKECFDAIVNDAMTESFPNPSVESKPWFSNARTTTQKLEAEVRAVSHLLACVFINDDSWIKVVESHNEKLHGPDQPLMDVKIMEAYFNDIPIMRRQGFELVSN